MNRNSRYWATCRLCNNPLKGTNLYKHFASVHNVNTVRVEFDAEEDFFEWKSTTERETLAQFVLARGTDKRVNGQATRYYRCHRDGYYRPRRGSAGKKSRNVKIQGSNKIDGHCPASMTVSTKPNGRVTVVFVKTHLGHTFDLGRISLSREEKEFIAAKMLLNTPRAEIIDDVRATLDDSGVSRLLLLKRSDFNNIIREYNLPRNSTLSKTYSSMVDAFINCAKNVSDVIRFYKPPGETVESDLFSDDDFCLIIADDSQCCLFDKYSGNLVCVDNFSRPNCDYKLFSVSVADEDRAVLPCGFMFSNRDDSPVIELFYKSLKARADSRTVNPKYFLSDLPDSYITSWLASRSGDLTTRMYNTWHVANAWRANLSVVSNQELQTFVEKQLMLLLLEEDQTTFESMSANFLQVLYSDADTRQYAAYFESFIQDPNPWAKCFRSHIDDDALCEFHIEVAEMFAGDEEVVNLERDVLNMLMLSRKKVFDRVILSTGSRAKLKASIMRSRHLSAVLMDLNLVYCNDDGTWSIEIDGSHTVSAVDDCPHGVECPMRCADCASCVHKYLCTCLDASVCWNMCVHIHMVCHLLSETNDELIDTVDEPELVEMPVCNDEDLSVEVSENPLDEREKVATDAKIVQPSPLRLAKITTPNTILQLEKTRYLKAIHDLLDVVDSLDEMNLLWSHLNPVAPALEKLHRFNEGTK